MRKVIDALLILLALGCIGGGIAVGIVFQGSPRFGFAAALLAAGPMWFCVFLTGRFTLGKDTAALAHHGQPSLGRATDAPHETA